MAKQVGKIKLTFGRILAGIVVLALSIGLVLNYLTLNEVSAELNRATKEHEKLVSRGDSLGYQIEQQVGFNNIDELAGELGMVKLQSYQVQHVDIKENDTMTAAMADHDQNEGLVDNIVASFNILVEYLK